LTNKAQIDRAIERVMASGHYIMGPEGEAFEREFAAWLGVGEVVGCANGTDAIALSIQACDVKPGARVATVSHTAVATVAAIELAGCRPVLLDVDDSYTMDVDELALLLEAPTDEPIEAVVAVHLYGQPANISAIAQLCDRHGVVLIEDCSQAHGAMVGGKVAGSFGHASSFSFYPTKNLGAFGDGGAVATSNPACAERLRRLRQYGWDGNRDSREPGRNSRLDELQAAILRVKLPGLRRANERRREIAAIYDQRLEGSSLTLPPRVEGSTPVFHQYVVRSKARDWLRQTLATKGVETAIHYTLPAHRQGAYLNRVELGPKHCRFTEKICQEIISLPIFPELTDDNVISISRAVQECKLAVA
jgi:dTDP-4-amino-4,6-dideoxygalactose transaminase